MSLIVVVFCIGILSYDLFIWNEKNFVGWFLLLGFCVVFGDFEVVVVLFVGDDIVYGGIEILGWLFFLIFVILEVVLDELEGFG